MAEKWVLPAVSTGLVRLQPLATNNTLEQLVVFLPALWAFAFYVNNLVAAGLGVVFLVGRLIYSIAYTKKPGTRSVGMLLSFVPTVILLLGAFFGAAWRYFF